MAKVTNDSNNQTYIYHQMTIHNLHDSKDDFRSGCRNVSQCQQQQFFFFFFSELHSHSTITQSHSTESFFMLRRLFLRIA